MSSKVRVIVILAVLALFAAGAAHAEVYRCVAADGGVTYKGTPCTTGTGGAADLPPISVTEMQPVDPDFMAQIKAEQRQRQKVNERIGREARQRLRRQRKVSEWIRNDQVGPGMTLDEVRDSWGAPDDIDKQYTSYGTLATWIYRVNRYQSQYVFFRDGEVSSVTEP